MNNEQSFSTRWLIPMRDRARLLLRRPLRVTPGLRRHEFQDLDYISLSRAADVRTDCLMHLILPVCMLAAESLSIFLLLLICYRYGLFPVDFYWSCYWAGACFSCWVAGLCTSTEYYYMEDRDGTQRTCNEG
jgi:hypothetical protein